MQKAFVSSSDNCQVFAWKAPLCITLHKVNDYFQYLAYSEEFYMKELTDRSKDSINGCLEKSYTSYKFLAKRPTKSQTKCNE